MTTLGGNHRICQENVHEYANVTHINGNATVHAECPELISIRGDANIFASCKSLVTIGGDAKVYVECPSLISIGGYADILGECPSLISIGGGALIKAECLALISIGGYAYIYAECPLLTSIDGKKIASKSDIAKYRKLVAHSIQNEPERFDMSRWGWKDETCQTTMCLAGWAKFHAPEEYRGLNPSITGALMLGPDVAPLFHKTNKEVLEVIKSW